MDIHASDSTFVRSRREPSRGGGGVVHHVMRVMWRCSATPPCVGKGVDQGGEPSGLENELENVTY
jgi:hypothetical protein